MTDEDPRRRWNAKHAHRPAPAGPATFLVERADLLPEQGRALDVAGGDGRNAVWLASRGLRVTLLDVSDEAVRRASDRAAAAGVDLQAERTDVARDGLPAGPWDLVLLHHYLDREAVVAAPEILAPGGLLLVCQPTVRNLERHERPGRRWLLEEGELAELVRPLTGVEVVELREGWGDDGRHEARLVLRAT